MLRENIQRSFTVQCKRQKTFVNFKCLKKSA